MRPPAKLSSHQAMRIRSVFPPSSLVPFLKSCFHSATRQARNRLFCKIGSALRRCHSPKARLISTLGKIGKSSTVDRRSKHDEELPELRASDAKPTSSRQVFETWRSCTTLRCLLLKSPMDSGNDW